MSGNEPPDWALPSWDSLPAEPGEASPETRWPGDDPTGSPRGVLARIPRRSGHLRGPNPRRQRGHPGDPWRRAHRPATRGPVGRRRDRAGHDLVGRACLLRAQGRAEPAPVRLVPRRPAALGIRGPGRAAGRGPRPDRPVRATGRAPALRRIRSSRAGSAISRCGSRRSRRGWPRKVCLPRSANAVCRAARRRSP